MVNNFKFYVVSCLLVAVLVCCGVQRAQIIRMKSQIQTFILQQKIAQIEYEKQAQQLQANQTNARYNKTVVEQRMRNITAETLINNCEGVMGYARNYAKEFQRAY